MVSSCQRSKSYGQGRERPCAGGTAPRSCEVACRDVLGPGLARGDRAAGAGPDGAGSDSSYVGGPHVERSCARRAFLRHRHECGGRRTVYVVGSFQGVLGLGNRHVQSRPQDRHLGFLARIASDGQVAWLARLGGYPASVAVHPSGLILVGGSFEHRMRLGRRNLRRRVAETASSRPLTERAGPMGANRR